MAFLFTPAPGIYLVEPISDENTTIKLELKTKERVLKGKVLAVGRNQVTEGGALIETDWYAKAGDIVYYLSYEGDYDNAKIEGKTYYFVKYGDIRGVVE